MWTADNCPLRPQPPALSVRPDRRGMGADRAAHSAGQARRQQTHGVNLREIVNGLMYILSTGCHWRAIPKDLPPRSTLYDYFDLWNWDGTLERMHHALYVECREGGAFAEPGADGAEQVGVLVALVGRQARSRAGPGPDPGAAVLLAEPGLVLEPDLDRLLLGQVAYVGRERAGEVFLNPSSTRWSWRGCCGRPLM